MMAYTMFLAIQFFFAAILAGLLAAAMFAVQPLFTLMPLAFAALGVLFLLRSRRFRSDVERARASGAVFPAQIASIRLASAFRTGGLFVFKAICTYRDSAGALHEITSQRYCMKTRTAKRRLHVDELERFSERVRATVYLTDAPVQKAIVDLDLVF